LTLRDCRIRIINYAVFNRRCPRELAGVPVVTEAAKEARRAEAPTTYIPTPPAAVEKVISVTSDNIMVSNIPLDSLELGAFSPRRQFDPNYIADLASSMEDEGQLEPILVRPHPTEPNKWQLIDGEHRVRALKKIGKTLVRAEIRPLGDQEADVLAMLKNELHGERLTPFEEGLHLYKLMQTYGWSQEEVGTPFHRKQQWVSDRVKLVADASPELIESFTTRVVNVAKARAISQLPKEEQALIVRKVVDKKLPIHATVGLVHAIKAAPEKKKDILEKPIDFYAKEFKDPKQLESALLTIKPTDDFLKKAEEIRTREQVDKVFAEALEKGREPVTAEKCPGCGREIRIDWVKKEFSWS